MHPPREPIAIVGSSCRFPGGADSPQRLWDLLLRPRNLRKRIPSDRFTVDGFLHEDGSHHGTSNIAHSYFLDEDPRRFDVSFFNINPREAEAIDPQHRLLLENVYEALESAGLSLESMRGTPTGVYVGLMCADYFDVQMRDPESLPQYHSTGTARSILSNRVSYFFDWKGPSMTIDTACSSSLVAVHQAVQALREGECTAAVAAGANLIFGPEMYIAESKLRMLSPTGQSRMWDASADGYARGEGMGVVVLKLLKDAIRDGDIVECVIRETGVNSDGRTGGITMPSAASQASLIRQTYLRAGLDPSIQSQRCQYFEAHGTGTPAGDPIEAEAIKSVFFPGDNKINSNHRDVLFVGSIKTVIGHTEGTAGIAGLLKASLALQNRTIPPNLHFTRLNPKIMPFYDNLQVPVVPKPWPGVPSSNVFRASVNSFGFGGTNAHCILERYDPLIHGKQNSHEGSRQTTRTTEYDNGVFATLPFSACSENSLSALIESYHSYLEVNPSVSLQALSFTLQEGRSAFPFRTCIGGFSREHVLAQMRGFRAGINSPAKRADIPNKLDPGSAGRILGIFTGQGAQWPTMGRELIKTSEIFSSTINRLEESLTRIPNPPTWSLRQELFTDKDVSRCNKSTFSQPLCTAIQIALVDLLHSVGVSFSVVVGHSSGEIAAAYASGCLTADAAIKIAYYRGLHSKLTQPKDGCRLSMMAVGVGFQEAQKICSRPEYVDRIFAATSNAPSSSTLAGDEAILKDALEEFNSKKVFARMLRVDKAYHSPYMMPCARPYLNSLQKCDLKYSAARQSCTWISSVHGFEMDSSSDQVDNQYWVDNLLHPVLFSDALEQAARDHGPFHFALEVGPHAALQGPTSQNLKALKQQPLPHYGTLKRGENDILALANCIGSLWAVVGPSAVSLPKFQDAISRGGSARPYLLKGLPGYAWDHETIYWREPRASKEYRNRHPPHELLGSCTERSEHQIRWRNILRPQEIPWLRGHKFQNEILFPAAGYCVMALEAARNLWGQSIRLIELRDVNIRRGIGIEEGSSGVEVIFSLYGFDGPTKTNLQDLEWGTARFSCSAGMVDGADPLSTRFTGSLRVQFGKSEMSLLPSIVQESPEMSAVDLDRFYTSMAGIGLEYTGAFRGLLNAKRRMSQASGLASQLPSSLSVHPGFLDSCFQALFLGFASPGDESLRTAFLPKSIKTLRFNPKFWQDASKGSPSFYFDAYITYFQPPSISASSYFSGDIDIFSGDGNGLIQVEGLSCVAFANSLQEDDRQMFYTTIWEQDISCGMVVCQDQELDDDSSISLRKECEALACDYFRIAEEPSFQCNAQALDSSDSTSTASSEHAIDLELIRAAEKFVMSSTRGQSKRTAHSQMVAARGEYLESGFGVSRIRRYLARTTKQIAHRYPRMKILELGGHNGATTGLVLDQLEEAFASYWFSDPSAEAVHTAQERLSEARNTHFMTLDINDLSPGQLMDHSFDLVIASNLSCTTSNAFTSLVNTHQLLKPGGFLLLTGPTGHTPFAEFIRTNLYDMTYPADSVSSSLVESVEDWRLQLESCGFSGIDSIVHDTQDSYKHCLSLILTQALDPSFKMVRQPLSTTRRIHIDDQILILGGRSPCANRLISELRGHLGIWKDRIMVVSSLEILISGEIQIPKFVLNLAELDDPIMKDVTPSRFQALQALFRRTKNIFWVTQQNKRANVYSAMTVGLGRVIATESPDLKITFLNIDRLETLDSKYLAVLFSQFVNWIQSHVRDDQILWLQEPELALEDGRLLIPRVLPAKDMNDRFNSRFRPISQKVRYGLSSSTKGPPVSCFRRNETTAENLIHVSVFACSSLAVKICANIYLYLCMGTINGYKNVLCFSPSRGPSIYVRENWLLEWTLTEGPSVQTLDILIGLQIARTTQAAVRCGTVVFYIDDVWLARLILFSMNLHQVSVRMLTSNPVVADIENSIILLHPFTSQRIVRKILPGDTSLFLNLSSKSTALLSSIIDSLPDPYARLDLTTYLRSNPSQPTTLSDNSLKPVLDALSTDFLVGDRFYEHLLEDEALQMTLWSVEEYSKVAEVGSPVERLNPRALLRSDATYFLVGMTGELGQSLCSWMVDNGVRYIAIASRSPKPARWHRELESLGCQIMVQSLDIRNKSSLRQVCHRIARSMPPIAGVVNGAMVLADSAFFNMKYEDFVESLGPKVDGSANLDELFSSDDLDFFIMLSSTASLIGNAGQSNYSAANMYMKAIAERRRIRGLAGSCIDIGMIIGVGVVARERSYEEPLRKAGLMAIAEPDFHCMFAEAIRVGQATSTETPWFSTGLHVPAGDTRPIWYPNPRFSHFKVIESNESGPGHGKTTASIRERLQASDDENLAACVVEEAFLAKLQHLLQLPAPISSPSRPLAELGIDSLLAIDIRTWFHTELDFQVSVLKILGGISAVNLCREATECAFRSRKSNTRAESMVISEPWRPDMEIMSNYTNDIRGLETLSSYSKPADSLSTLTRPLDTISSYTVETKSPHIQSSIITNNEAESHLPEIDAVERTEPMSVEQEKLWFLLECVEDPAMYNCTIQYEIRGPLDADRLKASVIHVAKRHESLRTAYYVNSSDGSLKQAILKEPRIAWTQLDINEELDERSEFSQLQTRAFDLTEGQTMAITLMSRNANHHIIIFCYHHIIMDGVSWQLVLREFAAAYKDMNTLPSAVTQYATFSNEQRSALAAYQNRNEMVYWERRLQQLPRPLPLFPFAKVTFRQSRTRYDMTRKNYQVDEFISARIRRLSSQVGATAFHFHLAAIQLFLQRILQVDRFCLGVANANRGDARFEKVVGLMVEILPMVFEPQKNESFDKLIQDTRTRVFDSLEHSKAPFYACMTPKDISKTEVHSPLFQIVVNYIAGVTHDIMFDESVLVYSTSEEANHAQDLIITIRENADGSTFLSFTGQDYLYEAGDIENLLSFYAHLIEMLSSYTGGQLTEYHLLEATETEQHEHSGHGLDIDNPWSDGLSRRISAIAQKYSYLTAIKDRLGTRLTYDDMEKRVHSIMTIMWQVGVKPDTFVVVACGPSADAVCALLAIWRIGAIYVPFDLNHGIERLELIIRDCQPSAIVCKERDKVTGLRSLWGVEIVELKPNLPIQEPSSIDLSKTDSTAVLLYTSGTTGVPKGVLLTHDNLQSHIMAVQQSLNLGREVVLQQSSHTFDASIFQMLNALVHGGTLIMTTGRCDPAELAETMVREEVSLTLAVPSEYALWIGEAGDTLRKCHSWQYAFCGGEKMTYATTYAFSRLDLQLDLINAYGPAEVSVACSMGKVPYRQIHSDVELIHIGRPLPSYRVHILDEQLKPVPVGWPGEICIGGPAVSSGYLNRDIETQDRFIDWSSNDNDHLLRLYRSGDYGRFTKDGTIEYRGRIAGDSQIKLRGIRLELDEISNAIIQSSKGVVSDAAVIAKGDSDLFLVGFVVFDQGLYPSDPEAFIRTLLVSLPLPNYAKPAALVSVKRIPLTGNGKIDRKALVQLPIPSARSREIAGLGIIEMKLKELWEEYLPATGISIDKQSNFFDLGGNSLLLLRLQARIRDISNISIPVPQLFQATTLEEMAMLIGITNSAQRVAEPIDWETETAIPDTLSRVESLDRKEDAGEVILTGATGFLGRALLKQLVENPFVNRVHCLAVRPTADGSSRKLSIQSSKIRVYSGDLSHATLSLSEDDISILSRTADYIIHNGADVSFLKTYTSLRSANVSSTKFLLGLALPRRVPFHYISTAGVTSLSQQDVFPEASVASFTPPAAGAGNTEGYVASKWASEIFLQRANAALGVTVRIHRPSSIIGSDIPATDILGSVFEMSGRMKAVPRMNGWKGYFDMIGVESAAKMVVNDVLSQRDNSGLSFSHVCGETRFEMHKLKEHMEKTEKTAFRELAWKDWVERARHYGLDAAVAVYMEGLGKVEGAGKFFLPLLDKDV